MCHIYKHCPDLYICAIFINTLLCFIYLYHIYKCGLDFKYKSGSLQKGCGQGGRGIARSWSGRWAIIYTIVLCVFEVGMAGCKPATRPHPLSLHHLCKIVILIILPHIYIPESYIYINLFQVYSYIWLTFTYLALIYKSDQRL